MMAETHALIPVRMRVNGRLVQYEIEARETLLDVLRDRLGLKGAKHSCDVQVCGACTVLVDGLPVSACCTLAYEARDREVTTIEGLAYNGRLHVLQEAFIEQGAVQCGFCTPGMILTALSLLVDEPHPDQAQIRHALRGNTCRCTGYWNILKAIEVAAARMEAEGA